MNREKLKEFMNKIRNVKFEQQPDKLIVPKDKSYLADVAKTFMNLDNFLFTKKKVKVGEEVFRVPRCLYCGKGMTLKKDNIANKVTGYVWHCVCKDYPKNVELCIG